MDIKIRPVAKSDRTEWEALFRAYADFYKTEIPDNAPDTIWDWIFDSKPRYWCDVAEDNAGRLIGFTQYQLMQRSLGGGMVCYMSDLFVVPGVRGGGTGKALIDNVLEFAKAQRLPSVRWLTQANNTSARKLYDRYQASTDFILYSVPT